MVTDSESWHVEMSSLWQTGWLLYSEPWIYIRPIQLDTVIWSSLFLFLFGAAKTHPSDVAPWKKSLGCIERPLLGPLMFRDVPEVLSPGNNVL